MVDKVIYEAERPRYVVQARFPILGGSYEAIGMEAWRDWRGFEKAADAIEEADRQKREEPLADFRVVETDSV